MIYLPKSQPAPACLAEEKQKKSGTYRCEGVLERLKKDFHNKCYLCERKAPGSINIEHLRPHKQNRDRMFDWNNLFFACAHCNNVKLDAFSDILDCTRVKDIEDRIVLHMSPWAKESVSVEARTDDESTKSTVHLLNAIYNGAGTQNKKLQADNLRQELLDDTNDFRECINDYYDDDLDEEERELAKQRIQRHLKSYSAFTAFKRQRIRDNKHYMNDFGAYLTDKK